jgi:hypothetical protein
MVRHQSIPGKLESGHVSTKSRLSLDAVLDSMVVTHDVSHRALGTAIKVRNTK